MNLVNSSTEDTIVAIMAMSSSGSTIQVPRPVNDATLCIHGSLPAEAGVTPRKQGTTDEVSTEEYPQPQNSGMVSTKNFLRAEAEEGIGQKVIINQNILNQGCRIDSVGNVSNVNRTSKTTRLQWKW